MESSDLDKGMAEAVAPEMPSPATIAACKWLPDDELRVFSTEFDLVDGAGHWVQQEQPDEVGKLLMFLHDKS
jgi:hypothetical protein